MSGLAATSSLRVGERLIVWSDGGLLAAEYALFDAAGDRAARVGPGDRPRGGLHDDRESGACTPGPVRRHGRGGDCRGKESAARGHRLLCAGRQRARRGRGARSPGAVRRGDLPHLARGPVLRGRVARRAVARPVAPLHPGRVKRAPGFPPRSDAGRGGRRHPAAPVHRRDDAIAAAGRAHALEALAGRGRAGPGRARTHATPHDAARSRPHARSTAQLGAPRARTRAPDQGLFLGAADAPRGPGADALRPDHPLGSHGRRRAPHDREAARRRGAQGRRGAVGAAPEDARRRPRDPLPEGPARPAARRRFAPRGGEGALRDRGREQGVPPGDARCGAHLARRGRGPGGRAPRATALGGHRGHRQRAPRGSGRSSRRSPSRSARDHARRTRRAIPGAPRR